jgi:predicted SnoaL-like aldol condensation-catalyzing enzyme
MSEYKGEEQEKKNEALANRFHMDIFQKGELKAADEILAAEFVTRNPALPAELTHGPDAIRKFATAVIQAIPDRKITHEDTMSKGDKVLIRWSMTGTPKQDFLGIARSDNPITLIGFDLFRISGGKIIEMWQQFSPGKWQ